MDPKSLDAIEFPQVLDLLACHTSFSAGRQLALNLHPTINLSEAQMWQQETSEARNLLANKPDISVRGVRDVRTLVKHAARKGVLRPEEILDVKSTLLAAHELKRTLDICGDQSPLLALLSENIAEAPEIVEAISRTLDERAQVLDSASDHLAVTRRELQGSHSRLLEELESLIGNLSKSGYLQDPIITQRGDRYVIPVKSSFRGRIKGIVHGQSSSGATLFIEPLTTVELNNLWLELQLEEENEIRRIMAELSHQVGLEANQITSTVEALAKLDLCLAKARYAEEIKASPPMLLDFLPCREEHTSNRIELRDARHPLLDPGIVVPVDVVMGAQTRVIVITGPNTGGKTVILKTVGLLVLMAQCGLHIPAKAGSEMSVFTGVHVDIGDEQSIEQNLSTFSSHITKIIAILREADDRSLVLLDEVGAGTDPGEGSALARAILDYLLESGATILVTTHYKQLKVYAHKKSGMVNASVDFDLETLAPTYRLTLGLPGQSNALVIADRLGLDERIVAQARLLVDVTDQEADDFLQEIRRHREISRQDRITTAAAREDVLRSESELAHRLEEIEEERRRVLMEGRNQAKQELEELRTEIQEIRERISEPSLPVRALRAIDVQVDTLEDEIQVPSPSSPVTYPLDKVDVTRPLRSGDRVWVERLQVEGVVGDLSPTEADVRIGRMRLRAQLGELHLIQEDQLNTNTVELPESAMARPTSPGIELHIRGQGVEDGLQELDHYLASAVLAELSWVRIIHGKGTGRLRTAVRQELGDHPLVESFEPGKAGEGGEGVTVVKLATG